MVKKPASELSPAELAEIGNKAFDEAARKANPGIKPMWIEDLEQEDAELAAIVKERMDQPEIEVDIEDL